MTRDELVQAAIEALARAAEDGKVDYYRDAGDDLVEGASEYAVEVVVDTVLAKLVAESIRARTLAPMVAEFLEE